MIERLPRQTFPIKMPNGVTFHPQNEALLQWFELPQWFEFKSPSNAINGAYSYPDIATLTALLRRRRRVARCKTIGQQLAQLAAQTN